MLYDAGRVYMYVPCISFTSHQPAIKTHAILQAQLQNAYIHHRENHILIA